MMNPSDPLQTDSPDQQPYSPPPIVGDKSADRESSPAVKIAARFFVLAILVNTLPGLVGMFYSAFSTCIAPIQIGLNAMIIIFFLIAIILLLVSRKNAKN